MEQENILYFDGNSARPLQVRVLLFSDRIDIYDTAAEDQLIQSFSTKEINHNEVGGTHYLYLDTKGLQYLQFRGEHPLAFSISQQVNSGDSTIWRKLMRQKLVVLLPLLLLLGTGLYFLLVSLVPFLGTHIIGVQQEIAMGDKMREVMMQEERAMGARIDTAGTRTLQAFADQLKLSKKYRIRVTLLKSKTVNAYALPGGQIVVYTGIVDKIKTPEALAALLAHESTHVNERHSLRSLLRSTANSILISVLFNDATGISGALAGNADALNGLRYSRSLETEADEKGMDLLLENGVNADGMRQLLKTLQDMGDIPGSLSFLSTHPLTKERIRNAERYIKKHPKRLADRKDLSFMFQKLK